MIFWMIGENNENLSHDIYEIRNHLEIIAYTNPTSFSVIMLFSLSKHFLHPCPSHTPAKHNFIFYQAAVHLHRSRPGVFRLPLPVVRLSSFTSDKTLKGLPQEQLGSKLQLWPLYTTENNGSCYVKQRFFWGRLLIVVRLWEEYHVYFFFGMGDEVLREFLGLYL